MTKLMFVLLAALFGTACAASGKAVPTPTATTTTDPTAALTVFDEVVLQSLFGQPLQGCALILSVSRPLAHELVRGHDGLIDRCGRIGTRAQAREALVDYIADWEDVSGWCILAVFVEDPQIRWLAYAGLAASWFEETSPLKISASWELSLSLAGFARQACQEMGF